LATNTVSQDHTHNTKFFRVIIDGTQSNVKADIGGNDQGNNLYRGFLGDPMVEYNNGLLHTESTNLTHNHTITG